MAAKKIKNKSLHFKVSCGNISMDSPVMVASGTFSEDFENLTKIKRLGGFVTKTVTLKARKGNTPPRICETAAGTLNSIGLPNDGINAFVEEKHPILSHLGVPIFVSISGNSPKEFAKLARILNGQKWVSGLELNISCPNVGGEKTGSDPVFRKKLGLTQFFLISQDPRATYEVVKAAREATKLPIITKLSPNVTDITEIAKAAEKAGADAVSLINTLYGMAIDVDTRAPRLGNVTGGLSGPAIKPVALRMVWETAKAVKIPVIGIGGIMNARDALEFIIAGASAVQVGTANFVNPNAACEIIDGIAEYMKKNKIKDIKELWIN